jgi:hypothetical protein
MPVIQIIVITACLFLGASTHALAQPARTLGVTMAHPASVGVLWQVSERFAIRPDVTVAWNSSETSSNPLGDVVVPPIGIPPVGVPPIVFPPITIQISSEGYTLGFGVSALWTVARWDALRAYVTPRVGYTRSSSTVTTTTTIGPTELPGGVVTGIFTTGRGVPVSERTTRTNGYQVGGSFGAQYSLVERFAVFGEVGVNYSSLDSPAGSAPLPGIQARSVGTRGGVGVIFFF